jgi:N-acetylmuramoyl-L-alanine amidase
MKLVTTYAILAGMLAAQTSRAPLRSVTAVRHWSLPDVTRIAIEVSDEFEFRSDRLHNPERVYYDILASRPRIDARRLYDQQVDDRFVKGIRVRENTIGITRIVLDLTGPAEATASQLINPSRLIIELRPATAPTATAAVPPAPDPKSNPVTAPPLPSVVRPDPPEPATKPAVKPAARAESAQVVTKPAPKPAARTESLETPATTAPAPPSEPDRTEALVAETSKAARRTSSGSTSLVRALGLKVGRVVIDPGHGGHDQGTEGAKGLLEKDVVLDVAMRVGKLVEDRLGAEVIYTRTDDTFIPLEGRTALANEKKADLFLSIHANSSTVVRIAGMETYYLNFTDSRDATEVASRENATSQKSISELTEIVQKITLHDKLEESKEFASRVQTSLYAFSARNFPANKNRGVKKAPFVVLIGARMPSVLAEIGFLSNPREEALLRKPEYRQKLAEALFRGLSRYAESLSHFQVAKAGNE